MHYGCSHKQSIIRYFLFFIFLGNKIFFFVKSGTCKMGPLDAGGVVNERLIVHGMKNLRVVDASVMPHVISGHTNAPTVMIAEKASDMVKQDWGILD